MKYKVEYSKTNDTYRVMGGDKIVTDFATKERADAEAKRLNSLQSVKDVDKAQEKKSLKEKIQELSLDQKAKLYFMGLVKQGKIDTLPEDPKAAYVQSMMDEPASSKFSEPMGETRDKEDEENDRNLALDDIPDSLREMAKELGYLKEDSRTDAEKGKDVDYIPHTSKDPSAFGNPDAKMYDSPNIKVNPEYDDFSKNDLEKLEININKITGGRGRESARVSDRGDKIRIKFSFMRDEFDEKTWNKIIDYLKEKDFEILDQSNNYEANYDREEPAEAVPMIHLQK